MAVTPVGYQRLIDRYKLSALPLTQVAVIDTRVKSREIGTDGTVDQLRFEARYAPEATFEGDLQFALRYEGLNLEVLELLFTQSGPQPLAAWLRAQPESTYARRVGFLYEWITGKELDVSALGTRTSYVPVLDESLQFGIGDAGDVNRKFRVRDNLPGTREFCPLIRKTAALLEMTQKDLHARAQEALSRYEPSLIRRAAQYLLLKETRSSYEVEREKPSSGRIQRFVDLLRTADIGQPLSQERFVTLQNAVLEPRWHEFAYRHRQNWVGAYHRTCEVVDFVPPRPEDVASLMNGLCALSERGRNAVKEGARLDPVVHATAVAFGFVFIHPFLDGNGRLHRYLIHEELSVLGFTPKGIVLPVSAFILANVDQYVEVLEQFSRPRVARTEFEPLFPDIAARGNDAVYFRFFDATAQIMFLYRAIEQTVIHDLREEIDYLLGLDRARARLRDEIDWPGQSLDLFINIVRQGGGTLSQTKRRSQFDWMKDEEIERFVSEVNEAFEVKAEFEPGPDLSPSNG
jgi:Fic family protein